MIRLLVLQQLYNLSDEALEYQVLDRSSFQRFAGLEHSGRVPDAKTLWVWRNRRIARQRAFGEHPFARLAQMGGKSIRTIGLARARAAIELKVIAHDLIHLARLQKRGIAPA